MMEGSLDQIVWLLRHDLTSIEGHAELIALKPDLSPTIRVNLEGLQRAVDQLRTLVVNLLEQDG